jgi:hypothetical protein
MCTYIGTNLKEYLSRKLVTEENHLGKLLSFLFKLKVCIRERAKNRIDSIGDRGKELFNRNREILNRRNKPYLIEK